MIPVIRWTAFVIAVACLVALHYQGAVWVALIFLAAFITVCATFGAFRKAEWIGEDPDPNAQTSLDVRNRQHP